MYCILPDNCLHTCTYIVNPHACLSLQEGVDYGSELRQLQNEADLPLDQLLDSLPPEMLASGDFPTPTPSVSDEAMEVEAPPTEDAIVETLTR